MTKTGKKKIIIAVVLSVLLIAGIVTTLLVSASQNRVSADITVADAQKIVDDTFNGIAKPTASGAQNIIERMNITVKKMEYGDEKNIELFCEYSVPNVKKTVSENKNTLVDLAYASFYEGRKAGKMQNATKICQAVTKDMLALLEKAETLKGEITLTLYETTDGLTLYLDDTTVDTVTGGIISANKEINEITKATYNGEEIDITNSTTLRTGIKDCLGLTNYDSAKPNTQGAISEWFGDLKDEFNRNFIEADRWLYLLKGLGTTLAITVCAGVMGIILGFVVAIIRCTHDSTGKFYIIDRICRIYLTVVRGTPVMVQLLIIYFVLLLPIGVPKFISAVLCFGLNSGAYVAEIVRGGIMSVDSGQNEAGRSLGFNFAQTMIHFIIPQAFKAVLPALANEFITLLKESSVAFYIGVADLTQGGLKIRSITYSNFMPLIAVAVIYLVIVLILTKLVGILERRLRKSER